MRARRFSSNMSSTVTNQGKVRGMICRATLSRAVFIRFLERLGKDAARKVFLIVDNLKAHHSAPVKAGLLEHTAQIEVFYLPSDSPERNPDEYLNGDLKMAVTSTPRRTISISSKTRSSGTCANSKGRPSRWPPISAISMSNMPLNYRTAFSRRSNNIEERLQFRVRDAAVVVEAIDAPGFSHHHQEVRAGVWCQKHRLGVGKIGKRHRRREGRAAARRTRREDAVKVRRERRCVVQPIDLSPCADSTKQDVKNSGEEKRKSHRYEC